MPSGFDFDELRDFEATIDEAPEKIRGFVPKALEFAARETKDAWRDAARGPSGRHARAYPASIDYDTDQNTVFGVDVWRAEIGPNLGRAQGALGILDEAPGGVTAAPQGAGRKAAKVAEEELAKGLAKAAEDAL